MKILQTSEIMLQTFQRCNQIDPETYGVTRRTVLESMDALCLCHDSRRHCFYLLF